MADKNEVKDSKGLAQVEGEIVEVVETLKELTNQMFPLLTRINEEVYPTLYDLRGKVDRGETLVLLDKVAENTDTFLRMMELMESTKEMTNQMFPLLTRINEEVYPTLYDLRGKVDRDETLMLVNKAADNIEPALKLLTVIDGYRQEGTLDNLVDFMSRPAVINMLDTVAGLNDEDIDGIANSITVLTRLLSKLSDPNVLIMLEGMLSAVSSLELKEPKKTGVIGLLSATRDDDIKTSMGILLELLKNLSKNITKGDEELTGPE